MRPYAAITSSPEMPPLREVVDRGVAILLIVQQAECALEQGDRGYIMRRGAVEMQESAVDLLARRSEISDAHFTRDASR
jgi:ABC-type branched-subunit amino acid transport system ATPase component